MDSYLARIWYGMLTAFLLPSIGANKQQTGEMPLQCYVGNNSNETMDNTIHLSDVVLAGRIISLKEGEFGTYGAVVSYYYAYKSDGLLKRRALSRVKVSNFDRVPAVGQLGMFFLFREPNMQLSLFCMTLISVLIDDMEDYQQTIEHINAVGINDTMKNQKFVASYPSNCDSGPHSCSGNSGAYCSEINTLPQKKARCSCLTGFYRNGSLNSCLPRTEEAADLHCSNCSHGARCSKTELPDYQYPNCTCDHIDCSSISDKPICGSDGRTYGGMCQMRVESCKQQEDIYRLYDGACIPSDVFIKPCMGMGEPLSTSSGLIQCLDYDGCPTQHFCHSTLHYKVCCPVLLPSSASSRTTTDISTTQSTQSTPTSLPDSTQTPVACSGSHADDDESSGHSNTSDDEDTNC